MLSEWAVMEDRDGIILNWYGPSTIRIPYKGSTVSFRQETGYPWVQNQDYGNPTEVHQVLPETAHTQMVEEHKNPSE